MAKNTYNIDIDGYIGEWYYSKRYVRQELEKSNDEVFRVRMNSLGGQLDHGLDISDRFSDHGNVEVDLFGFNASAATLATLGAKTVRMSASGFYLIHKVMNWIDIWGSKNADEIATIITELEANKQENEKMDLVIAQKYSDKTGKSINELLDLMKVGGWLNATEAKEWGFVDEIIKSKDKVNMQEMQNKLNAFGLPTNMIRKENLFTNKIEQPMKKQFIKVNAILGVEKLESTEEGVYLNEAQIEALDTKVNELETSVTTEKENARLATEKVATAEQKENEAKAEVVEKEKKINKLTAEIKTLKGTAGDGTSSVVKENDVTDTDHAVDSAASFTSCAKSAKEMYDMLP